MNAFNKLSLAGKLWLPTIALAVTVALVATLTALRTRADVAASNEQQTSQMAKVEIATRWAGLTETNVARVVGGLMDNANDVQTAFKPELEATTAKISELQKQLEAISTGAEEKEALAAVAATRSAYIAVRGEAGKQKAAGDLAGARAVLDTKVRPAIASYLAAQQAFVTLQHKHSAELREAITAQRMRTVAIVIAIMAGITAMLAASTFLLSRAICVPLREAAGHARRIGAGDLSVAIDSQRGDEIGDMLRSLAQMQASLNNIVGDVRASADSIRTASSEVAVGNLDLSQRTEKTASNLQQTASSMSQLTSTVRQTADSANTANQLAASAAGVAQRGGAAVSQVVSTMSGIHAASRKISDIIGTIDGIAFQTNILALNAAVEAARAGEQGRGFAVVAGEVRNLAQRSAEAAREIKALIGASVEQVESGSRLVTDAGSTMAEIVASVQRVTDIIGEITAAASEQSQGIGQVNGAVSQLDQMTQQNAALVEQSTAAAESLKDQAQRLSGVVATFKLDRAGSSLPGQSR